MLTDAQARAIYKLDQEGMLNKAVPITPEKANEFNISRPTFNGLVRLGAILRVRGDEYATQPKKARNLFHGWHQQHNFADLKGLLPG